LELPINVLGERVAFQVATSQPGAWLYWRAYSQYIGSLPSTPVTFGSPPTAVPGGGASGPAPQPSTGSGFFPDGVPRGGNGFGIHPGSRVLHQTIL